MRIQRDVGRDVVDEIAVEAEARSAHGLKLQLAGGREHRVADLLGAQATRREAPEQAGVLVDAGGGFVKVGRLQVGLREDDLAVQGFQFPAVGDKSLREEVEELRVRRLAAHEAEVARGVDEAGAEVVMPQAIREHAGGDGVVLGDPLGQGHAAFAFARVGLQGVRLGDEVQHGETGWDDLGSRLGGVAAFLDEGRFGFGLMGADPGGGELGHRGDALVDVGELAAEGAELLGFGGRGHFLADAFEGVRRRPGLAIGRVGDFLPVLAVERDIHLIFGRGGALGVVAEDSSLGGAVAETADLLDAGQGDDEFGRGADIPLRAFVAVDGEGGAVGHGKVFGGDALDAFGLGAVGGEGDIAGRRLSGPDLELGDTSADTALRVGGGRGHGELYETGLGRRDGFLGQQGVRLRARILASRQQGFGLGFDGLGQGILLADNLGALFVQWAHRGIVGLGLFLGRERTAAVDDAFEGRTDAVIVFGRDGVELMVVAAGAVDGEAEKRASGRGDHVVERGRANHLLGGGILIFHVVIRTSHEESAADLDRGVELAEHVPGEVLAHELVEGLILVQRADDVVAERIEVIDDEVTFEPVAFAEADDVEPVAAPVFAIARRGQQAVDEGFGRLTGVGLMSGDEGVDLGLSGRQAGEVIAETTDQRLRFGRGAPGEFLFGQLGVDKTVDVGVLEFLGERLEGPPGFIGAFDLDGRLVARVDGPGLDPGGEVGDERVGQLRFLRRHLHVRLEVADVTKEQAFVGFARDDDRGARIAAFLPAGLGVEREAAFQFLGLGAMAFVAVLGEGRADLLFEERDATRVVGGDDASDGE